MDRRGGLKLSVWHPIYNQQVVGFTISELKEKYTGKKLWDHQYINMYNHRIRRDHLKRGEMQAETRRLPWSEVWKPSASSGAGRWVKEVTKVTYSPLSLNPDH